MIRNGLTLLRLITTS